MTGELELVTDHCLHVGEVLFRLLQARLPDLQQEVLCALRSFRHACFELIVSM